MNIQEAFTKAKAGKVVARGDDATFPSNSNVFYVPAFSIGEDTAATINFPIDYNMYHIGGGFYKLHTDPDLGLFLRPYAPSDDDILATDWIEFPSE